MALAISQKGGEVDVRFVASGDVRIERTSEDGTAGLRSLRTAATASSKFSSLGLPDRTRERKTVFSL